MKEKVSRMLGNTNKLLESSLKNYSVYYVTDNARIGFEVSKTLKNN